MTGNRDWKKDNESREAGLADAMDRSDRELKLLANFYHQHGYLECAQEIYRTMLKIQEERHDIKDHNNSNAQDDEKSA